MMIKSAIGSRVHGGGRCNGGRAAVFTATRLTATRLTAIHPDTLLVTGGPMAGPLIIPLQPTGRRRHIPIPTSGGALIRTTPDQRPARVAAFSRCSSETVVCGGIGTT